MSNVVVWIVCRNYETYLTEALASVKSQTVSCNYHVTHDDCGGKEPRGVAVCRNDVMSYYDEWKYVIFLDADDVLEPNYVEEVMKTAHGDGCVVATPARLFGDESRVVAPPPLITFDVLMEANCVHCSALVPLETFRRQNGFSESPSHEDWELWARLAFQKVPFRTCYATHLNYRRHAGSRSKQSPMGHWDMKKRLHERFA